MSDGIQERTTKPINHGEPDVFVKQGTSSLEVPGGVSLAPESSVEPGHTGLDLQLNQTVLPQFANSVAITKTFTSAETQVDVPPEDVWLAPAMLKYPHFCGSFPAPSGEVVFYQPVDIWRGERISLMSRMWMWARFSCKVKLDMRVPLGVVPRYKVVSIPNATVKPSFEDVIKFPGVEWDPIQNPSIVLDVDWHRSEYLLPTKSIISQFAIVDLGTTYNIESVALPLLFSYTIIPGDMIFSVRKPVVEGTGPNPLPSDSGLRGVALTRTERLIETTRLIDGIEVRASVFEWLYTMVGLVGAPVAELIFPGSGVFVELGADLIWNLFKPSTVYSKSVHAQPYAIEDLEEVSISRGTRLEFFDQNGYVHVKISAPSQNDAYEYILATGSVDSPEPVETVGGTSMTAIPLISIVQPPMAGYDLNSRRTSTISNKLWDRALIDGTYHFIKPTTKPGADVLQMSVLSDNPEQGPSFNVYNLCDMATLTETGSVKNIIVNTRLFKLDGQPIEIVLPLGYFPMGWSPGNGAATVTDFVSTTWRTGSESQNSTFSLDFSELVTPHSTSFLAISPTRSTLLHDHGFSAINGSPSDFYSPVVLNKLLGIWEPMPLWVFDEGAHLRNFLYTDYTMYKNIVAAKGLGTVATGVAYCQSGYAPGTGLAGRGITPQFAVYNPLVEANPEKGSILTKNLLIPKKLDQYQMDYSGFDSYSETMTHIPGSTRESFYSRPRFTYQSTHSLLRQEISAAYIFLFSVWDNRNLVSGLLDLDEAKTHLETLFLNIAIQWKYRGYYCYEDELPYPLIFSSTVQAAVDLTLRAINDVSDEVDWQSLFDAIHYIYKFGKLDSFQMETPADEGSTGYVNPNYSNYATPSSYGNPNQPLGHVTTLNTADSIWSPVILKQPIAYSTSATNVQLAILPLKTSELNTPRALQPSHLQVEALRHLWVEPNAQKKLWRFRLTSVSTAFANGRLLVAHIPYGFSRDDITKMTLDQLVQFPRVEHEIKGGDTVFEPSWTRPLPVMPAWQGAPEDHNGHLAIVWLEHIVDQTTSEPLFTLWVQPNGCKYSVIIPHFSFVPPSFNRSLAIKGRSEKSS